VENGVAIETVSYCVHREEELSLDSRVFEKPVLLIKRNGGRIFCVAYHAEATSLL
jgi:hypothetical protein